MKKFHQISGFVSLPVMVFSALVGLGLLSVAIYKNSDSLSLNKGNLLGQVSQLYPLAASPSICSSPDDLSLSSTCTTVRCGTHFGAPEYFACSGTCAGGVNAPQTCALPPSIAVFPIYPLAASPSICSSPDDLSLSSTCTTARCGTHFGAPEYFACSGTCAGGVNAPQTCNGREQWLAGSTVKIRWKSTNVGKVTIQILPEFATYTMPISEWLASDIPNTGIYEFRIPANMPATTYLIRVYGDETLDGKYIKISDQSDAPFTISAPAAASIKVLSPNGGESWVFGNAYQVKFQQSSLSGQGKINLIKQGQEAGPACLLKYVDFGKDIGSVDIDLNSGCLNKSEFGDILSGNYKINVYAGGLYAGAVIQDSSDNYFTITAPAPTASIKVLSPNGGESWYFDSQSTIRWEKTPFNAEIISIQLLKSDTPVYRWDPPFFDSSALMIGIPKSSNFGTLQSGNDYKIRVNVRKDASGASVSDDSDAPFTISAPTLSITEPKLTISVSAEPKSQNIIAGTNQVEFARYVLDATASGEDLIIPYLPVIYGVSGTGNYTDLTSCKLYTIKGGSFPLNTGVYVINPAGSNPTFTFDRKLTILRGVTEELSLKCDIKSAATGSYQWGYSGKFPILVTGLTSGRVATITEISNPGQAMNAISGGTLSVSLDTLAPYQIVSPGQTVELARLKFSATGENIAVKQVALQLSNPELNTPNDLVGQTVTLWDGATKVGEAVFASGDNAISSAITNFVAPAGGSKVLTVKGVIANISAFGPLTKSGDLLKVDYDGGGVGFEQKGNYGVGQSSGQNVFVTGSDTNSTGVRIMKAYPEFALDSLTSAEKVLPSAAQDNVTLYKFKVTAKNGDLSIAKFTFQINSKNYSFNLVSKVGLYAFTDSSYSSPDGDFTNGLLNFGQCYNKAKEPFVEIYPDKTGCNQSKTSLRIPSGESRWFKLRASVNNLAITQQAINVQLEGDGNYLLNDMQSAGSVDSGDANNNFIWSPRSTSTNENNAQYIYNLDWTNGYGVPGLPSDSLPMQTLTASGYSDSSGQQTISALQAQIQALLEQIKSLQDQLLQRQLSQPFPGAVPATTKSSVPTQSIAPTAVKPAETVVITPVKSRETFSHTWNVDLNYGLSNNADVRALQNALILENVYKGEITGGFFSATRQGVVEFQKKYNLPEYGFVGKYTRAKLNELYSK